MIICDGRTVMKKLSIFKTFINQNDKNFEGKMFEEISDI